MTVGFAPKFVAAFTSELRTPTFDLGGEMATLSAIKNEPAGGASAAKGKLQIEGVH